MLERNKGVRQNKEFNMRYIKFEIHLNHLGAVIEKAVYLKLRAGIGDIFVSCWYVGVLNLIL